jgi:hypothetical protein
MLFWLKLVIWSFITRKLFDLKLEKHDVATGGVLGLRLERIARLETNLIKLFISLFRTVLFMNKSITYNFEKLM